MSAADTEREAANRAANLEGFSMRKNIATTLTLLITMCSSVAIIAPAAHAASWESKTQTR